MKRHILFVIPLTLLCANQAQAWVSVDEFFEPFDAASFAQMHQVMDEQMHMMRHAMAELDEMSTPLRVSEKSMSFSVQEQDGKMVVQLGLPKTIKAKNLKAEVKDDVFVIKTIGTPFSLQLKIEGRMIGVVTAERMDEKSSQVVSHSSAMQLLPAAVDFSVKPEVALSKEVLKLVLSKKKAAENIEIHATEGDAQVAETPKKIAVKKTATIKETLK